MTRSFCNLEQGAPQIKLLLSHRNWEVRLLSWQLHLKEMASWYLGNILSNNCIIFNRMHFWPGLKILTRHCCNSHFTSTETELPKNSSVAFITQDINGNAGMWVRIFQLRMERTCQCCQKQPTLMKYFVLCPLLQNDLCAVAIDAEQTRQSNVIDARGIH